MKQVYRFIYVTPWFGKLFPTVIIGDASGIYIEIIKIKLPNGM